jgi:hypothetical protein
VSDEGQEREQLVVAWTGGPLGVDRVAVHREEIARFGGFPRPKLAILFEVFHVEPDRLSRTSSEEGEVEE